MQNVLFICSQNKLRSPTAEQVFADWADIIFVMEKAHRSKVQGKYRASLNLKRLICLNIPDDYDFMDPGLVELLKAKVPRHL
ncbi:MULTISPECIES: low molecular weight protein tyrosine phosphatase family protein [unclassified Rhizobium]|uniref:low molecular weight protein tyrosine phosphatase family protein n=1 Tax=unclassified Rhizobium TaxID=2613769 RepID=UPI000712692C|nr:MULTISPECIES: hypothetical protein [unclassified Rhizobium]KQS90478.1 phosphotyrosine protein phosphatase [Rhizobium sp. Leaf386]KQS90619.1 phosphotyrosine protein phosphatase [Rhizobium sp. Leaf391]KQU10220.1 phosphotyrosine protein phosphatase [Rhizobium sp. Leaf453]